MRRLVVGLAPLLLALGLVGVSSPVASAATRDPVVIVAGTFSPQFFNEPLAARLRADGYDTSIFVIPNLGLGDIRDSGRALDTFVAGVRARTGAAKVDLVGHSQGGLVAREFIKNNGGSAEVDSLVNLGTPNYGTAIASIAAFLGLGDCIGVIACQQMAIGSSYLNNLNAGDDTIGSISYTNIYTIYDQLVRHVGNAAMRDGATNVLVQSQCLFRVVDHLGLALDGAVYDGIRDALLHRSVNLNCFAL